jgi:hypothetical protein
VLGNGVEQLLCHDLAPKVISDRPFDRFSVQVYTLCFRLTRYADVADDHTQETFVPGPLAHVGSPKHGQFATAI